MADPRTRSHHRLEIFRSRLEALERDLTSGPSPKDQMAKALHDLQAALEEVEVADEEMALQNEELLTVHEALAAELQRYRDLFELAPDGYLVTDPYGTILEANRAAVRLLQVPHRAIRGKPLAVFVADSDRARFRALFPRLVAGERIADWEVMLKGRHRPPMPALLTVTREAELGGRQADLLWIVRDVSEVKAAQEALQESEERLRHAQRMEAVGRLAGGIAHSFNNLLAAISFHLELLSEGLEKTESGEGPLLSHAEEIRRAGERAAALARQLLAFSRKQVLLPRVIAVNEVVSGMKPMISQLIGEHTELITHLDEVTGAINVDLAQLEQVLLNLLVNARDAMPDGGRCTVETAAVEIREGEPAPVDLPAGPYVLLAVADTGIGIDAEVKAHLFEPFFTTKDRDKGTGLGLATVYGIVRQSGGDMRVESEPGEGARFEIYLPRVADTAEPLAGRPTPQPRRGGSEVILLAEDEENIRAPAVEMLAAQGYRVLAAANGGEALELARRHKEDIHLLVTDVIMPGMTGSQLAEHLEKARPKVKVLYISGYPEDAIARHGVLEPGEFFLQKPFPPSQFLRTIREVLDTRIKTL